MSTKSERSERTPRLVPDAIAEREENSEGRRRLSNHMDDVPLETVDRRKLFKQRKKESKIWRRNIASLFQFFSQ